VRSIVTTLYRERRAEAQQRALYLHTKEGKGKHSELAQLVMRKNGKETLAKLIDKDRETARQERKSLERSGDVSDRMQYSRTRRL